MDKDMLVLVSSQSLGYTHRYVTYKNALVQLYATSLLTSMVVWKSRDLLCFRFKILSWDTYLLSQCFFVLVQLQRRVSSASVHNSRKVQLLTSCIYRNHHDEDCQTERYFNCAANDFDESVQLRQCQ